MTTATAPSALRRVRQGTFTTTAGNSLGTASDNSKHGQLTTAGVTGRFTATSKARSRGVFNKTRPAPLRVHGDFSPRSSVAASPPRAAFSWMERRRTDCKFNYTYTSAESERENRPRLIVRHCQDRVKGLRHDAQGELPRRHRHLVDFIRKIDEEPRPAGSSVLLAGCIRTDSGTRLRCRGHPASSRSSSAPAWSHSLG